MDEKARAWLEVIRDQVTPEEYDLLARAQATLLANVADPNDATEAPCGGRPASEAGKPLPWHPRRGIHPSRYGYRGIWNWDSAFHAIAVARWDPELAREQFEIMLGLQQPDGSLPDVLMENGNLVTSFGKPPVMPWAVARADELHPDADFLADAYDRFIAYEQHWMRDRGGAADGLFHYGGGEPNLESGWDNAVRWDQGCDNLWTVDLNCFMVMLYEAMAYMAKQLDILEDRVLWRGRAMELGDRINDTLWDDRIGAYADRNRETGEFSDVLSPASFMPLYVKIAVKERGAKLAKLAANPRKIHPGMPTVNYDHPQYDSRDFWRGPMWLNVAYFALKGLRECGHRDVAEEIRRTILGWCRHESEYLFEYYDSRDGTGLGAKQFSWTATFVIEFILDW